MSFKLKDSLQIGATSVFNSSGVLLVNAPTATALAVSRAFSITGDVTATGVNFDGTGPVALSAVLPTVNSNVGTFNNFTVNGKGLITAASNVGYLTSYTETDTLSSVTGRGATTATAVSITNATASTTTATGALVVTGGLGVGGAINAGSLQGTPVGSTTAASGAFTTLSASGAVTFTPGSGAVTINPNAGGTIDRMIIGATTRGSGAFTTLTSNGATTLTVGTSSTTTGTGALVVTGGVGVSENLNVGGNAIITGNLTVNGTTTTTNSTTVTVVDPILDIGGGVNGAAPASDDAKDRGVVFQWHNGTVAKKGFFGWDRSLGQMTFIPDATVTSEVVSGSVGTIAANLAGTASIADKWTSSRSISTSGDAIWSVSMDGSANASAGLTLATVNSNVGSGFNNFTVNAKGLITAATTVGYLTSYTETDTLSTVTGRGATTATAVSITNATASANNGAGSISGALAVTGGIACAGALNAGTSGGALSTIYGGLTVSGGHLTVASGYKAYLNSTADNNALNNSVPAMTVYGGIYAYKSLRCDEAIIQADVTNILGVTSTQATHVAIATVTQTAVDSWAIATFRSAKYLVQVTQGTNYQLSEVMVIHNGTTTTMTEFAVMETNGSLVTLASGISGGNARLLATMGSATAATIKIQRVLMYV